MKTSALAGMLLLPLAISLSPAIWSAQDPTPTPAPTPAPAQTPAEQTPRQEQPRVETKQPAPASSANPSAPPAAKPAKPEKPDHKAWRILKAGITDEKAEKRAKAVNALGLLPGNAFAAKSAIAALGDDKDLVRLAAASALGSMHAVSAKAALQKALEDTQPTVVLAAANSLMLMKDNSAYDVYYEVLTGNMRTNQGLVKEQLKILKDKKKMTQLGIEEGLGFIPFASIGYTVMKTVMKDDSSPIRAVAAKKLALDPDPISGEALVSATSDKSWIVRTAALEAIAQRGDRSLLPKIAGAMDDEREVVRFAAAACVAHLSEVRGRRAVPPQAAKNAEKPAPGS